MAHMEDVLDRCAEPYDTQKPVVCFDETSIQVLSEARPPISVELGQTRVEYNEYRRECARNPFLVCKPFVSCRHVAVTERRTAVDFAHQMHWPVDEAYPGVPAVRVAVKNLNTHRKASLYQAFPAAEARQMVRKLEFHYCR